MTKEQAIKFILSVLKNPLRLLSPDKNRALTLATEHDITVADLIESMTNIAGNI